MVDHLLELSLHAVDPVAEVPKILLDTAKRPEDFVHLTSQVLVLHTHHVHLRSRRVSSIGLPAFTMTAFNVHDQRVQQNACVPVCVGRCTT
jgi:hypothetical protein